MPTIETWHERAACAGQDTDLWFPKQPIDSPAITICRRCPARPECLYDALQHETYGSPRYGIRGGLTTGQRQQLPPLEGSKAMTIAALRTLLDEIDAQGGPEAARQNRLHLNDEGTQPMTTAPALRPAPPVVDVQLKDSADVRLKEPAALPVGQLLKWGDEHPDPEVQHQAARARAALAGLRQRHAADAELNAITTEAEQLEKRLAELRAREAELVPAKQKRKRSSASRDYDSRKVRAWADTNGVECPRVGQIPKRVLDAWRAANAA